jgi:hypothetical protein
MLHNRIIVLYDFPGRQYRPEQSISLLTIQKTRAFATGGYGFASVEIYEKYFEDRQNLQQPCKSGSTGENYQKILKDRHNTQQGVTKPYQPCIRAGHAKCQRQPTAQDPHRGRFRV